MSNQHGRTLAETSPTMIDVINRFGTRQAAAAAAGVCRKTIHNWLRGRGEPMFSQGISLCRGAGVDPMIVYLGDTRGES